MSIAMKARWAVQKGFRGIFFWQIAADRMPDGSHPLQETAQKILSKAL
jgi:chitinase